MKHRWLITLAALILTVLTFFFAWRAKPVEEHLPGENTVQRQLVRIWLCSSVGGGESWLRSCLKQWEKQHPQVMTFLRSVTPEEISREDAVLPDILLYTPGDITAPEEHFVPMTGITGLREPLLRAGRWQTRQYGLPLCYGGYAIAIDSASEPQLAVSPAPTTLLGRPAATKPPDAPTPGLPDGASPLASKGCGLFTLGLLAPQGSLREPPTTPSDAFTRFRARQVSAALLTTGQITALNGLFPFRVLTPSQVITDQVWFASLVSGASNASAQLLAYLTAPACQRLLAAQGLHTVREDLRLYAAGSEADFESAAQTLTVINAYVPAADVEASAWQFYQGRTGISDALVPLV